MGKINTLEKVQPKIQDKIKEYYLPLALNKCKENINDVIAKQTKIYRNF